MNAQLTEHTNFSMPHVPIMGQRHEHPQYQNRALSLEEITKSAPPGKSASTELSPLYSFELELTTIDGEAGSSKVQQSRVGVPTLAPSRVGVMRVFRNTERKRMLASAETPNESVTVTSKER